MSVRFPCPICSQTLEAAEADRGRRTRCAHCQSIVTIPPAPAIKSPPTTPSSAAVSNVAPPPAAPRAASPRAAEALPPRRRAAARYAPPPVLRSRPQQDDEIDMTPMIDVVFQLLIFFMVTSAFALQKTIPMPTPDASEAAAQQVSPAEPDTSDVLNVRIDADDAIWVEDVQAISRPDLIAKLRRARTQNGPAGEPPPRKLQIAADPEAHHETVVDVLDAGSAAGMEEVRLAIDDEPQ